MQITATTNLASLVLRHEHTRPDQLALVIPTRWDDAKVQEEVSLTFGAFADLVRRYRQGLVEADIRTGDRVVLMFGVRPELYLLALAMLAHGVVVVLIDAGMGKKGVLQALSMARARAIVTIDDVLKHRFLIRQLWGLKKYSVDGSGLGVRHVGSLAANEPCELPCVERERAPGLITFTSGTTGKPKGANRTHDLLIAQHLALSEHFPAGDNEVDMPCFPVVPLHNLCSGITTVMPAVDFRSPKGVSPRPVLSQVQDYGVTRLSGAPAYLQVLAQEMLESGTGLDSVRTVGCGGAPTPRLLCRQLAETFPRADRWIIYGSTEAEPIASVDMDEFVKAEGSGYLVGTTAESATVSLVRLPRPSPVRFEAGPQEFEVEPGEPGELLVCGPHVLRDYVDDEEATRQTKIQDGDRTWHRTRDIAYRDDAGRLWLLGRLDDELEIGGRVVHPFLVESRLDSLPAVRFAALIKHEAAPEGELCMELRDADMAEVVADTAISVLAEYGLETIKVSFIDEMPVDPRHNSKIDRPRLRSMRAG